MSVPIKQEQPQLKGFTYPTQGIKPITPLENQSQEQTKQEAIEDAEKFVEENFKGLSDFIKDADILIWYKALIVSAITDYQYQPKQEAIEDVEKIKEYGEITYKVMIRQSGTVRDGKGNVIIPESDLLEWFGRGLHLHKYTSWDTM